MHTIGFSLTCHVGKTYCEKVMEHFVRCITGFTSRRATRHVPDPPFLCLLLTLSLSFPICLCFLALSPHRCRLSLAPCPPACLSDWLSLSLPLRSSDVNPLQGSAFWGLAKWHPCYPECSAAGQGHIHLQCTELSGSWQVRDTSYEY